MTWRSALAHLRLGSGPEPLRLTASRRPGPPSVGPDLVTTTRYSKFKHGDGAAATAFGRALAHAYLASGRAVPGAGELVVTSSGFDVAPPAAHALVEPFCATLREHDVAARTVVVRRTHPSDGDYATMGARERAAQLTAAALEVGPDDRVGGATVVALDDVRVTGVHERSIERALRRAGAARVDHLFLVDAAGCPPQAEAALNAVAVRDVDDLLALAAAPGFVPNARVARWILGLPSDELDRALALAPVALIQWVAEVAARDRFAALDRYHAGARRLRSLVDLIV